MSLEFEDSLVSFIQALNRGSTAEMKAKESVFSVIKGVIPVITLQSSYPERHGTQYYSQLVFYLCICKSKKAFLI